MCVAPCDDTSEHRPESSLYAIPGWLPIGQRCVRSGCAAGVSSSGHEVPASWPVPFLSFCATSAHRRRCRDGIPVDKRRSSTLLLTGVPTWRAGFLGGVAVAPSFAAGPMAGLGSSAVAVDRTNPALRGTAGAVRAAVRETARGSK